MNTQWELYFLRREIERQKIQKQRKKKRRIWIAGISRSEERRVGKECSEPCRSRWSPYH